MFALLKLAWRNLWRSKRRTLITALSVAGAVWMAVTFLGIGEWAYNDMVAKSAKMGFGHVSVSAKGYNDAPSISKRLPDAAEIVATLKTQPGIEAVAPRVMGQGMFATARKTAGGLLLGIDPALDDGSRNLFVSKLTTGAMFKGDDLRGVVVGARMAKALGLKLGSKLVWTATDVHGEVVSEVARVRGMFTTGVAAVDAGSVLLPIAQVRKVLGMKESAATVVAVFLEDHRKAARVRDALAQRVGERGETLTWEQTQPEMASYVQVDRASNEFFQLLIGLVVAAGILNTMLMGVLERKRELGVLLAIGMHPVRLFVLVMLESACVGVLGLLIGTLLVIPWAWFLHSTGIDMSGLITEQIDVANVVFDMTIRLRLADVHYVAIPVAVLLLTMTAAIYPAAKAARLEPIDSLRALE